MWQTDDWQASLQNASNYAIQRNFMAWKYAPKPAYSSDAHSEVCNFPSQKEYTLLGRSISRQISMQFPGKSVQGKATLKYK